MKKTTLLLTLLCTSIAMSKTLYVTGDNIPVFDSKGQQIGVMARGTFGEEVSQSGDKTTIKVQGYIKKDDVSEFTTFVKALITKNTYVIRDVNISDSRSEERCHSNALK